jgi:hypothetical protein
MERSDGGKDSLHPVRIYLECKKILRRIKRNYTGLLKQTDHKME